MIGVDDALWDRVVQAYRSPGRHYHTLDHVLDVAARYREVSAGPGWQDPATVLLAVLAHDAVYVPGAIDNEARSAALAQTWAGQVPGADAERAAALVLATANHRGGPSPGQDLDLDHFLDCDMAVLGADPRAYDAYAAGVAAEYAPVVGADAFAAGRAGWIRGALGAERLFRSAWFGRLEAAARGNLRRELAGL